MGSASNRRPLFRLFRPGQGPMSSFPEVRGKRSAPESVLGYKARCLNPGSDLWVKIKLVKFHRLLFLFGKNQGVFRNYNDVVFIRTVQLF